MKQQQLTTSTSTSESTPIIDNNSLSTIYNDPHHNCQEHNLKLEFICHTCDDSVICYKCFMNSHNGHDFSEILTYFNENTIKGEKQKILQCKENLENNQDYLQQLLQNVENNILKVNIQKDKEIQKLDQSINTIINELQKKKEHLQNNLNQLYNERMKILENEKNKLIKNIEFIQKEVKNIKINELNNGIDLIKKRKELIEFELNNLLQNTLQNNLTSLKQTTTTLMDTFNQFEVVLSYEEKEWLSRIDKQFGYVVDGIVNPSLCEITDIPKIFFENDNYKLELQLKSEKGNIENGGYLIKSFLYNIEENKIISDCNIIDNNDGTYFIEFQCPVNVESFKLKTFIEDKEMKVNEFNVFNYNFINIPDFIENKFIKLYLKINMKVNLKQPYLIYDGCNGKEYCKITDNNDNTFIIEFKCPSTSFKLFTNIDGEKELLLNEFKNIINLVNYSEIINYYPEELLMEKQLMKLTLQLKSDVNINYYENGINVRSFLTLKENNSEISACKVFNNNNGTFTIEFQSPSSPFILNTLIEEKKMKTYEFNNIITTELNNFGEAIIENQNQKLVLKANRNDFTKIESFITSIENIIICQCKIQNNNDGSFTIEFESPPIDQNEVLLHCLIENRNIKNSPYKYTIVKPESNITNDIKLKFNQSNSFILQFKNKQNQLVKIEKINIQPIIHLNTSNLNSNILCKTINNNNGTFNIQFNTPMENKNNTIYLSIKINEQLSNNMMFEFLPNYGESYSNEFIHYNFVGCGKNIIQFNRPDDIKIDEKDNLILVADTINNRIQVFDIEGGFKFYIPTPSNPYFVAVDYFREGKEILVGCSDRMIYRFEKKENGKQIQGNIGNEIDQFKFNHGGIVTDQKNGNIYISDGGNNRIKVYSNSGQLLNTITGGLENPQKLDINSKGQLVVADYMNSRVVIFNQEGKVISIINTDSYPLGLVVDKTNDNIYVTPYQKHSIDIFNKEGKLVGSFGCSGKEPGQFSYIRSLALHNGRLYCVEWGNNRIQIFK